MDAIDPWRVHLLDEAKSWLRTPWHHNARVKGAGAGVDCGQYLIGAYVGAGLVPDFDTGEYPVDWMLHRAEERFLYWVERYLDRVDAPLPGDVAVWRYAHCFAHGAIVVDWPIVLHSFRREGGVVYGDATKGGLAREHLPGGGSVEREVRFYSIARRL